MATHGDGVQQQALSMEQAFGYAQRDQQNMVGPRV